MQNLDLLGRLRYALSGALMLALAGCAGLKSPASPPSKLFERSGVSMVVAPADTRETYFSDPKSGERHCRAPSPDVSVTASGGVSMSGGLPMLPGGSSLGVSEATTKGALALGGRDPAVLITRELMYRACEVAINLNLSTQDSLKLYRDVMDVIVKIATVQTGAGSAPTAATPAAPQVIAPTPGQSSSTPYGGNPSPPDSSSLFQYGPGSGTNYGTSSTGASTSTSGTSTSP